MSYNIMLISGIEDVYAARLNEIGISTTGQLLAKGSTRAERLRIAELTGIEESKILSWVNLADLHRVEGLAGPMSELIHMAGVQNLAKLANKNAARLTAELLIVNYKRKLTPVVPSMGQIQEMIDRAKALEALVFE
ncbi:MAG: DUF4332 domain-containing protein [Ferruginibacter sp.]